MDWRRMMEFRILGPLEARAGDQPIVLDALWGDDAAGKEKALWVHISRLRSALEPHRAERGESSVLITRDHGYLIRSDPESVDARRFEAAVSAARVRLADEPDAASEILRAALDLWRGAA